MVHRALLLPEVVAAILNAGSDESGLLYNCLLVNHLFLEEARRILWSTCDSSTGVHPDIQNLGEMVLRDDIGPHRAQVYANLVRELSFHYDNTYIDQTSWHSVLCQLQFPQLVSVSFWETDHGAILNTEAVILHYAKSNLRRLSVDCCVPLSDYFFDAMAGFCSRLNYLLLRPFKVTASSGSVVRMLEKMPNIDTVEFERGFQKAFSLEMLRVIASYPNLNQTVLPYVQDGHLLAIQADAEKRWFPKLRYLYISATAETLRLFCQLVPGIEAIGLRNHGMGRTNHVLTSASGFRQLTSFTAQLSLSTVIHGDELIQLAKGCPGLEELNIGIDSWSDTKPSATGITDDLIRELALHLSNLKQLYLLFESDAGSKPGCIQSIQTLGQHCKKLEELALSCRFDWPSILSLPQREQMPLAVSLEQLELLPEDHMRQSLTEEEYSGLLDAWRYNAKTWLPQLRFMMIRNADDWEEAFIDARITKDGTTDEESEI
ncbi:hypothetical protein yc1106_00013 [Curvularia clavata]|uniref:Uncharacterized protein n=1 Tax=Curvularia clavata TaxID=95742 RepID=A0A9Q8Z0X3_CURCL|nr:hypothetical protein yc1106_00013 [Curvularia clavata]